MIPSVVVIGLAFGFSAALRPVPAPLTMVLLAMVAAGWGVLVEDVWGVPLAAANAAAGAASGYMLGSAARVLGRSLKRQHGR